MTVTLPAWLPYGAVALLLCVVTYRRTVGDGPDTFGIGGMFGCLATMVVGLLSVIAYLAFALWRKP